MPDGAGGDVRGTERGWALVTGSHGANLISPGARGVAWGRLLTVLTSLIR